MTEERKVQLGIAVDASDAKAGFDQVKQGARDMAQAVGQAGQAAGKGMDAIGDGAKRSADAMNREEGRMRAAIQRATLELRTLGKTASEKLQAKIELQGLDPAKFAPYLAALKQAEDAQRKLQESSAATGAAIQRAGMTWNEFTGQRMGPVMKDFTDQGLPHKEAHTAAIRQIGQEWQQYKAAGVAAQTAVATQTASTTAALTAEAGALSRVTTSLGATSFTNLDKVGTSLGAAAVKADEATAAVKRLDRAIELTGPLATAGTSFGAAVGPAAGGLRGAIERRGAEDAARGVDPRLASAGALATAGREAEGYSSKLRAATAAQDGLGMSTKQLNFALRQVPMQMTDIVVSLASGQRPFQILLQQGGQLKDLFGGIGPAAKALGSYALGLVNPFTVAAAAVAGLGLAMAQVESRARGLNTLQAQLAGTGRSGMFSDAGLKDFIKELALAQDVSRETATAIVSEMTKANDIGTPMLKDLARSANDFAKATGTDAPNAMKTLTEAFADPAKGAKKLDELLNGLFSSGQLIGIENAVKAGDLLGARMIMLQAVLGRTGGTAAKFSTDLQESFKELGNAWEGAMTKLDQSTGLRNLNTLLGETVKLVTFLVKNADKIGGLGNIGVGMIPGIGAPAAVANAVPGPRGLLFGSSAPKQTGGATGSFGSPIAGTASASSGGADAEIKRALEAGKAYRGQAGELADLGAERKRFNSALTESIALYGKESEQAKRLRQAIAGVDERIASVKKRGSSGAGANEPQQVIDAQLQQSTKAARDALDKERDNIAFSQRFLQGVFQAGEISLRDFYDEKRKTIEQGVAAQLAALEKERIGVVAAIEATKKTSPKDTSTLVRYETRLLEIDADKEKVSVEGQRQTVFANQEAGASFKQLSEQVLNYRANLLQLQGDEIGAARIRAQIAIEQAKTLAASSQRSANPITAGELESEKRAIEQIQALNEAKTKTSAINQILQIEEERIALAVRTGAAGEIEALNQLGGVRAKAVAELEKIVKAQEEVAASRPQDYQLQIDTSRARLELDKLKAELDPLKEKFDGLFKDAGAGFLEDLMNGAKPKDALKSFFGSIGKEINSLVAKELSADLFGKGGALGGAGGFLSTIFGKKPADAAGAAAAGQKPALDTSAVTASLSNLQTVGADPATAALARLQAAADAAAGSIGQQGVPFAGSAAVPPVSDGTGATGDFARFDRGQTSGETAVMGMFKDAEKSGDQLASVNDKAANSILQFAQAAARGGDAMSMLPSIINMIQTAAAAMSAGGGGGGGGFLGSLGSLFSTGSMNAAGGFNSAGFGTGAGFGNMDIGLFLHSGGIVGKTSDRRPVPRGVFADAGKYHAGGMVGGSKEPKLAANEVPAILMGGPKGTREEVLHASDPRHSDNLSPAVLKVLQSAPNKLPALLSAPVAAERAAASSSSSVLSTTVRERTTAERQTPALFKVIQGAPGVPGRAFALSVVAGVGGPGGRGGDSFARAQGGAGGDAEMVAAQPLQRVPGVSRADLAATGAGPAAAAGAARILIAPTTTRELTAREVRESVLREARQSTSSQSTTTATVLKQAGAAGGKGGDGAAAANVDVSVAPSVLALLPAAPRLAGEVDARGPVAAAVDRSAVAAIDLRALAGRLGKREEVLAASDARHKDNIAPALLQVIERAPANQIEQLLSAERASGDPARAFALSVIGGKGGDGGAGGRGADASTDAVSGSRESVQFFSEGGYTGNKDAKQVAGVVHGKEYVFSAPAVRALGVERLERLHTKAKYGLGRTDEDELPGYSDGGYVAVMGSRPKARGATPTADRNAGVTNNYTTVQVTAGAGVTREQAMNQGRDIRRGMHAGVARRGRDI